MKYANIIRALLGERWAIVPDRLNAIIEVLDFQARGGKLSRSEIDQHAGEQRTTQQPRGGIAVLPLVGIIAQRMNQVNDISGPGGTSTEVFGAWFDSAMADPSISAIVLDVDSPGGTVFGVPELSDKIFNARGKKRIIAVANSEADSAAYWIASAADELVITPSGQAGSIGVYAMHVDQTAWNESEGLKVTIVKAGKFKAEFSPHTAMSDDAREFLQESIDRTYGDFVAAVARNRGVSKSRVAQDFGQGRSLDAVPAVEAGLGDRVGTLEQVLADLGAGRKRGVGSSRAAMADIDIAGMEI